MTRKAHTGRCQCRRGRSGENRCRNLPSTGPIVRYSRSALVAPARGISVLRAGVSGRRRAGLRCKSQLTRASPTKPIGSNCRDSIGRRLRVSLRGGKARLLAAGSRSRCPAPAPGGRARVIAEHIDPSRTGGLTRKGDGPLGLGFAGRALRRSLRLGVETTRPVPSETEVARVYRQSQRAVPVQRHLHAGKRPAATS